MAKPPPGFSDWITLLGFFEEKEALNIVKSQGIFLEKEVEHELQGRIRKAIDYVRSLHGRDQITPRIEEIAEESFVKRAAELEADPTFREHLLGVTRHSFAMVELEKLHAFQPNINSDYLQRLKNKAPEPGDLPALLAFCLPSRSEGPKLEALASANPSTNTFTLISQNLDLRIVGQITGEDPSSGRSFVGFAFGGGLPQISVAEYRGVYMVKNGYHRALALWGKGHRMMPCILVRTEQFVGTGASGAGFFNLDLIMGQKSPLLVDFHSPAAVVHPRPLLRKILTVHGEVQVVPV